MTKQEACEILRAYGLSQAEDGNIEVCEALDMAINLLKNPKKDKWTLCSEKMPENEQVVEITYTRQHYKTGETLYLTARAFYEDGTLTTEDSAYVWNEVDNWDYDDKKESYIVPEGWFESVSFTDEFGGVDMPVIAWKPCTKAYNDKY